MTVHNGNWAASWYVENLWLLSIGDGDGYKEADFYWNSLVGLNMMEHKKGKRPSADSKFVLSILKFLKYAQFLMYTQNHFGILKS